MPSNYGAGIPDEFNRSFRKAILKYADKQRDKLICRNCSTIRPVGIVSEDTVQYVEGSGGNAKISASVTAKGALPPNTGVKVDEVDFKMFQLTSSFFINERDLKLSPELRTRNVEWCSKQIYRLEDYLWINGDASLGLTGLVGAARANPNGKITAYGAGSTGPDKDSVGNWYPGDDAYRDIYDDVLEGTNRLGDNFDAKFMIGTRATVSPIRKMDDLRKKFADDLLDLFGANSVNDFLRTSAYVPAGYVYIVGQDMEGCEMAISEDLDVDTSYGKEAGKNFRVELGEWINPCEFHDKSIAVEIYTL